MFIGFDSECWNLTESSVQKAIGLRCNYEEVDTRLLLPAKNATEEGYEAIVIFTEDTDVFVSANANSCHIQAPIYLKSGT